MKKLENFSIREQRAAANLIATHEELLQVPETDCITYYFGDYAIHTFKYGITDAEFRPAYQNALNALGTTSEEFETRLSTERYKNRYNVIADMQSELLRTDQAQSIKPICTFEVRIDNESVFKSYSSFEAIGKTVQEKTNPQNLGKKVEIVTAFADTGAVLNIEDWGVVNTTIDRKYELTDIRQSVSISGETLYRIKALRDFTNDATGVEIKAGQLGGYVQSENNLSHSGTCWVDDNARVFNNAKVTDDAYIGDESMANKNTVIKDSAIVTGAAWITQSAKISGNAYIRDMAFIKGKAEVSGTAEVTGHHTVTGKTVLTSGIHAGTAAPAQITMQSQSLEI